MKRKPNNGAGPEPREAAGAADPGGAGEGSAGGTSGQSVPKSKFRQKSNQEKAAASKLRMEKRGEKLDRAKEKLAKQKPPKKPGPVRRVGRVASGSAHSFVHGKIYENEHENVGIEGAHRSELVGESALRHGSRFVKRKIREHPAKAVQKAESRYIKATADYHFHTAAQEHPELSKNALSRFWQKRRLRKRYQKQAKEAAKYGAQAAGNTAVTTEKLAARAVGFVKRHPVGCLLALACVLLVLVMQSCSSSLVTLGNSTIGAVGASTYPCEDGVCWEPKPPTVVWKRSSRTIWTATKAPTTMTSTTSTWTKLSMIPMCFFPFCVRSMKDSGRLTRWRALCKRSLTASTF